MNKIQAPKWFLPVSIVGLLWNIMGIFNFSAQMTLTSDVLAQLPEAERLLIESTPIGSDIAFAIGVFGGTIGCIGLLLFKKWSKPLLQASLVAVILQMNYWLFFTNAVEVYGTSTYVLPVLVMAAAFGLYRMSRNGIRKGYLN